MKALLAKIPWGPLVLLAVLAYPLVPAIDAFLFDVLKQPLGPLMPILFIYAILALGLNVVVGYTGLLHLGIAAFFGIGAYVHGILTVESYPFKLGFLPALLIATTVSTILGVVLSAPMLRLRGDYLALVTLGFGLVMMYALRNLESITGGMKGINPIPPPNLDLGWGISLAPMFKAVGISTDWAADYRLFYYLALGYLLLVYFLLRNLERSRLGRAWVALREDELAATCMGINSARLKLAALAVAAALAGLAGALFATRLTSTSDPSAYDFNRSMTMICCLILGGLGNRNGVLIGVLLVIGYDQVLAPVLDAWVQRNNFNPDGKVWLSFSGWKLMIFGVALILMMRLRPEGVLPSSRMREEMDDLKKSKKGV